MSTPSFTDSAIDDAARVLTAEDATVTSHAGDKLIISSLFPAGERAILVIVFIRHFSCGSCASYVEALSEEDVVRELQHQQARLLIIGNGHHRFIESYKDTHNCPYDIFADHERHLYHKLKLQSSLKTGAQPEYTQRGIMGDTIQALKYGLGKGTPLLSGGGSSSQNGGEFILIKGEDVRCIFASRMQTTRDHTPPNKLLAEVKRAREGITT